MNTHDIEPMKYGVTKSDDYVTGWNDCYAAIEADRKRRGEPVGEAGTMPGTNGFTMAVFKAEDVPVGTKVHTAPQPAEPVKEECAATGQGCSYGPHGPNNEQQCKYCGETPDEPVKVPSNDEILSLWMRHGAVVDFARALLVRYGNQQENKR